MKPIKFAGIKQGWAEVFAVLRVLLSAQHASDKECDLLEREFAEFMGVEHALTLNSGSSANLLALKVLDLPKGSKVITSACGFPATLSPILHLGLKPVLVDYDFYTQNIDLDQVEKAAQNGAEAIIFAHTMGNPVDMTRMMEIARKYNLKVIEDCCEAVGSKFNGKYVGTFGDLATYSFYPTHQINGLGGGGMLVSNKSEYIRKARSMRNWGKLAKSPSFSKPPKYYTETINGIKYHEQYTYDTIGFNMLMSDVQAAYLRVQLKRLPKFIAKRKKNWEYLSENIKCWMTVHPLAEPAYFGFTVCSNDRDDFVKYLEDNGIKHRPFFAGNIIKHEPFKGLKGKFPVADTLMEYGLFFGVWQGMGKKECDYIIKKITEYGFLR
jgi:CDP-4-dehydro-6-deoxyglucose reductase, E1